MGMLMVAESVGLLYIGMRHLKITGNKGLYTFVFNMLILGDTFTIHVLSENGYFLGVFSSKTLTTAICAIWS